MPFLCFMILRCELRLLHYALYRSIVIYLIIISKRQNRLNKYMYTAQFTVHVPTYCRPHVKGSESQHVFMYLWFILKVLRPKSWVLWNLFPEKFQACCENFPLRLNKIKNVKVWFDWSDSYMNWHKTSPNGSLYIFL